VNLRLALGFAQDCARCGPKAEALAYRMANVPPDEARGASPKEFLSVCGVLAVAASAAAGKDASARAKALELLEARADDPRFRVRDAVPVALAMLGAKMGPALAKTVASWMDRYFHATAVLLALSDAAWLETLSAGANGADGKIAIGLLHDAFVLARDAPRSAVRYPGHKALVEALASVPKVFAKRFGVPVFDELVALTEGLEAPELRAAILGNVEDVQLKNPFGAEIKRVKASVEASKKPPRDPTRLVEGMRGRGKKRGRR
jgi:hypothetical protein